MNYRHAFHAGNFADVFKHAALLVLLDGLCAKDKPLCYFESHAGSGSYRLTAPESDKTGEWRDGIGRVFASSGPPAALQPYLAAVRALNADGALKICPGSPWLAAHVLRAQDELLLCDVLPTSAAALRRLFRDDRRVHVHARDGYEAMRALLPPHARRGLVLIDPPFEVQSDDFKAAADALLDMHARWPTGVYAVWYPIKSRHAAAPFHRRLAQGPFDQVLVAELLVHPADSPLRMNGCGLLIVNPPWHADAALATLLPALRTVLAQSPRATHTLRWLRHGGPAPRR
ncbi:MAG TPA: 23S rRNA (adenine(2030)-N(6))-methyltransferase RlmJ [Rhodanobacteraceae bacterium]